MGIKESLSYCVMKMFDYQNICLKYLKIKPIIKLVL